MAMQIATSQFCPELPDLIHEQQLITINRRNAGDSIRWLRALWTWAAQNRPDGNLGGANVVSGVRSNEGSTAAQRREPDVGSTRAPFVGA